LTELERLRIWKQATLAASRASEHITSCAADDPAGAADAAWAASDFLAAAGRVVEGRRGGPLTDAARTYDEAARELHGTVPAPTSAGNGLRAAGRLLLSAQVAQRSEIKQLLALMAQLSALTDAVIRLREAQDRAAQARAARRAAEAVRAVSARYAAGDLPWGTDATAPASASTAPTVSSGRGRPAAQPAGPLGVRRQDPGPTTTGPRPRR
jgi:hypothetical protein